MSPEGRRRKKITFFGIDVKKGGHRQVGGGKRRPGGGKKVLWTRRGGTSTYPGTDGVCFEEGGVRKRDACPNFTTWSKKPLRALSRKKGKKQ